MCRKPHPPRWEQLAYRCHSADLGDVGGDVGPQIQYSQQVLLNFNGLSWPHVSVATLVPASPLPVPASPFT